MSWIDLLKWLSNWGLMLRWKTLLVIRNQGSRNTVFKHLIYVLQFKFSVWLSKILMFFRRFQYSILVTQKVTKCQKIQIFLQKRSFLSECVCGTSLVNVDQFRMLLWYFYCRLEIYFLLDVASVYFLCSHSPCKQSFLI